MKKHQGHFKKNQGFQMTVRNCLKHEKQQDKL